jgi:hypothetical protein
MEESLENHLAFESNTSAFVNEARSVLQYALEECKVKPGGQAWYSSQVSDACIAFFKGVRDKNVRVSAQRERPERRIVNTRFAAS